MKLHQSLAIIISSLALLASARAVDIEKSNVVGNLNTPGAWVGGVVPGVADVAVWNNSSGTVNNTTLGDSMAWRGVRVVSWSLSPTIRGTSGKTLMLGNGGVDLSASAVDMTFNPTMQVELAANQTWNIGSGRSFSSGVLGASAGFTLTKEGLGTLKLNGTVGAFAGSLLINAGSVNAVNASGNLELAGPLSGGGALGKTEGAGALTLSGANPAFSGPVTLAIGGLNLKHAAALGSGSLTITGGSLDNTTGGAASLAQNNPQNWNGNFTFVGSSSLDLGTGAVTLGASPIVTVNANTLTLSGPVNGAGNLTKAGSGTLVLNPSGGAIGQLGVADGTVRMAAGAFECTAISFGSGTATLDLEGGTLTSGPVSRTAGTATFRFNGGTLKARTDSASFMSGLTTATVRVGGAWIDPGSRSVTVAQPLLHDAALGATVDGGLTVNGGGTLTLTGACTYTGPTTVSAGTLMLGAGGSIASSPRIELAAAGALDGGTAGTTVVAGQTLTGSGSLNGKLVIGPGATLDPGSAYVTGAFAGSSELTLAGTASFLVDKGFAGITADSVACSSVKYGGSLTVTAVGWALAAGDSFKLFDAATYSGAFTALNLPDMSFQGLFWDTSKLSLDGSLSLINRVPPPVFNPPGGACFDSQSVIITGLGGSTIYYTTDGSDPLSSGTTISGASPVLGVNVPVGTTNFTIRAYASLAGYTSSAVGEVSYEIIDTGTWILAGSGTWSEVPNWFGGLVAQGAGKTADFSTLGLSANATVTLEASRVIGNMKFGVLSGAFDWSVQPVAGATLTLNSTGKPAIQVVSRSATLAAALAGTQGVEKTGAGTLLLTGANTLTGGTTITGGTLRIGDGTTTGTLGPADVLNNSILEFYRNDTYTVSNTVSGTGKIHVKPGGTLSLTGALTATVLRAHEGGSRTVILGGTQPNAINALETNQDGHCVWVFAKPAGVNAFSGPALDVGNGYNSTSRVRLENDEQIPDTTRVNLYGTQPYYSGHNYFDLNGHNETIAGVVSGNIWTHVGNGATPPSVLTLAGGDTYGFVGSVNDGSTGTLSLVKTGAGTQTFSGDTIDYTGTTTVNAGKLVFSANDDCWTSRIEIAAGATVEVARDSTTTFENQANCTITGAGTYQKSGNGTMDMNWSNAGSVAMNPGGLIWVKEGTLRLGYGSLSNWTNNKADLTVDTGTIFDLWDNNMTTAGVVVDAINGGGQIVRSTYGNTGNLTIGVDQGSGTFSGIISNATGTTHVIKNGTGTQVFSGINSYTGTTTINGGTLLVNGALAAGSAVSVAAAGTLGGTGTAAGTVNAAGSIAPGDHGVGTLTTGATILTGTYQCQLDGAGCDLLAVVGNLNLTGSALAIEALAGGSAQGPYVIATYTGSLTGTFASVPAGFTVDYTTPNQVKLTAGGAGFASWIASYGLSGNSALPGADPDRDGVANAVEFVLGGNPATVMDAALLPSLALVTNPGGDVPDGSYLRFTYRRTPASAYLNPGMEFDADLTGTWTAASGAPGAVQVLTAGFYTTPTPADRVEVFVPRGTYQVNGKLYGRLRVSVP